MTNRKRVLVLGCGHTGEQVVREVVKRKAFSSVVIADIREEVARRLATELAGSSETEVSAKRVDVLDEQSLLEVMKDVDLVVNITRYVWTGVKPLKAAIKAKADYVDISDTIDLIKEAMALDESAKAAGVTALMGFGSAPGMLNVVVRYGVDKLDEVDEIHTALVVGRPIISANAMENMWRNIFGNPALIYKDGQFVDVPAYADKEIVQLPGMPEDFEVMSAKLAFLITVPHFIKGVKLVTLKAGWAPPRLGNDVICSLVDWGLDSREAIDVKGTSVVPADFAVAFLASEVHAEALGLAELPELRGGRVRVVGRKDGKATTYTYSFRDVKHANTYSTCALGAKMLAQGDIKLKGVLAPEALDPEPFIRRAKEGGLIVQEVREQML